jgi:hypothetical protein
MWKYRMDPSITVTSQAVFLAYAKDAVNWAGTPLVGGNVGGGKGERGNLTQLKRAGLIVTQVDEGNTWIYFTDLGRDLARQLGVGGTDAWWYYSDLDDSEEVAE